MSDLFVFVCEEPFLSGTVRGICETQSEALHLPWLQPCSSVQLSQPSVAICISTLRCGGQAEASHSSINAYLQGP